MLNCLPLPEKLDPARKTSSKRICELPSLKPKDPLKEFEEVWSEIKRNNMIKAKQRKAEMFPNIIREQEEHRFKKLQGYGTKHNKMYKRLTFDYQ